MKIKLTFDHSDEIDKRDFDLMMSSSGMYHTISDFKDRLRALCKHGHEFKSIEEALDNIYNILMESLKENDIYMHF